MAMAVCWLSARTCSLLPRFCRGRALARRCRPWLWPASGKFVPSLPWTSRTPPNAWPPASFQSLKLCEFIPISAASALNPASVNSSSVALRIPSSIASAPTASSSPPSPTPPNLDKLRSPHAPSADAGDEGWVLWILLFVLARHRFSFSRHSPLLFTVDGRPCGQRPATRQQKAEEASERQPHPCNPPQTMRYPPSTPKHIRVPYPTLTMYTRLSERPTLDIVLHSHRFPVSLQCT